MGGVAPHSHPAPFDKRLRPGRLGKTAQLEDDPRRCDGDQNQDRHYQQDPSSLLAHPIRLPVNVGPAGRHDLLEES